MKTLGDQEKGIKETPPLQNIGTSAAVSYPLPQHFIQDFSVADVNNICTEFIARD